MASNMTDHSVLKSEKSRGSSNVINVTTSETMRLDGGGDRTNLHIQSVGGGTGGGGGQGYQQKKKNSSFQITSITSRLSNDPGDDSADDTEDISDMGDVSRVTDYDQETPSYSEDYSKTEEVFFGPAPVIPTSSQYGITALVQQTGTGGVMTARLPQGVTVNVTEGGIALAKADGDSDDVDHWQNRFKIVKIDSNEPFKRGRWICLDFMDSPAVTATSTQKKDESMTVVINSVGEKDDSADHQPQTVLQVPVPVTQQSQTTTQNQSHPATAQYQVPHSSQAAVPLASSAQPTQGSVPLQQSSPHMSAPATSQGPGNMQYPSQGAPMQGQLQPTMSQGYANATQAPQASVHPSPSAQTPPQAQPPLQPQLQQQQQQAAPSLQQATIQQPPASQSGVQAPMQATSIPQGGVAQATVQQSMVPSNSHAQPQHQQPVPTQSTMAQPSINTQSIPQQGMATQPVSIPQSVAQPSVMGHTGIPAQPLQPNVMSGIQSQGVSLAQPVVTHQGVPSQSVMSQPQPGVQQVPQQTLPQSVPTQNVAQSQQQINPSMPSQPMPGSQSIQQAATTQQIPSGQQLPVTQQHTSTVGQATLINQSTIGSSQVPVATPATSVQTTSVVPQASHGSLPSTGGAPTPATTPAQPQAHLNMGGTAPDSQQPSQAQPATQQQPPTNLEGIPVGQPMEDANATPPAPSGSQPEDTESASTASTVAIDNKIEQAMDLVKSHLMFAVREEVEVLKEKISELMERINQLEYENTVLRQYATQEALQQLQQPHHSSNT
ncbi:protein bunched, class 2/F/G isoform-like isoform X4 [Macrobrachium rosenbergii]|uniref:protein bunched, class 2/F/G isoform-like isoform X4 n=1 Tax=Macrobrachium rosenbergii TaxID=79674 RepID=UPI0034D57E5A